MICAEIKNAMGINIIIVTNSIHLHLESEIANLLLHILRECPAKTLVIEIKTESREVEVAMISLDNLLPQLLAYQNRACTPIDRKNDPRVARWALPFDRGRDPKNTTLCRS